MSERKVLTKYYPPDFDPSKITRQRKPKDVGPKLQTVRLMAPFSMKCTHCGEFIYRGRKFNARKETTDEKYYAISIYRFYIRCTRCSSEITFKTDPKNMDYECERGAKRNFEPWREAKLAEETEQERLDRLEREEAERDSMKLLEGKVLDAKTEMAVADALDEIRMRNARVERGKDGDVIVERSIVDEEKERTEREIEEQARKAFETSTGERVRRLGDDLLLDDEMGDTADFAPYENGNGGSMPPPTTWTRVKKRKDTGSKIGALSKITPKAGTIGISNGVANRSSSASKAAPAAVIPAAPKATPAKPVSLVAGYDSDSE